MENLTTEKSTQSAFFIEKDLRYDLLVKSIDTIEDYAILMLDPQGFIQTWNHGARKIKGYLANEIIGKHFSVFYSEEEQLRFIPHREIMIAQERGRFEDEGWRLRKSGEKFWANVVITALKDETGKVVAFSKVTRDLTEKKIAEERIRLSEENQKLLANHVQDYAIYMMDIHGRITSWNTGAMNLFGYSPEQIIGKHFSFFYAEEEVKKGMQEHELKMATGPEGRFESTGWRIRKDGSRFLANFITTPLKDENNKVIGYAKVSTDLTSKKRISELEESIRMRDEFISVASHELRTPVTKILLNLQLIKRMGEEAKERMLKSLDVCEQSTKELIGLMDNLVDVTRLRLGKLEIKRTKTNITTIVLNVLTKFKDNIRLSGNHVSFVHDGDMVGYWDQTRLEQLFSNLLSNALKYGEGKPIKMELRKEEDRILFSISDEGPGIPQQLQGKVFERFERAADSKKISGLGLGLYVSRQIVEAHKGEISLESQPGKGAKFIVSLPVKHERR